MPGKRRKIKPVLSFECSASSCWKILYRFVRDKKDGWKWKKESCGLCRDDTAWIRSANSCSLPGLSLYFCRQRWETGGSERNFIWSAGFWSSTVISGCFPEMCQSAMQRIRRSWQRHIRSVLSSRSRKISGNREEYTTFIHARAVSRRSASREERERSRSAARSAGQHLSRRADAALCIWGRQFRRGSLNRENVRSIQYFRRRPKCIGGGD